LPGPLFLLAARLGRLGDLVFGLGALPCFVRCPRFGIDARPCLDFGGMLGLDAAQRQSLQFALGLYPCFGRDTDALFSIAACLRCGSGHRFRMFAALRGFAHFGLGLQAQLQRVHRLAFQLETRHCGRFLFLFRQGTTARFLACAHFGGGPAQCCLQRHGLRALAFACNVERFAACIGQHLGCDARFLFATFFFARQFDHARLRAGACLGFLFCGLGGGYALRRLPARKLCFPGELFGGSGSAIAQFGFGGKLLGGSLARFLFCAGALLRGALRLDFGFRARAQFNDFLLHRRGACFAGFASLAFRFESSTAGRNCFLGGPRVLICLGGGGGFDAGPVFGQTAGARFRMRAIFRGDGRLGFRFDARNRFTDRLQIDAGMRRNGVGPATDHGIGAVVVRFAALQIALVVHRLTRIHAVLPLCAIPADCCLRRGPEFPNSNYRRLARKPGWEKRAKSGSFRLYGNATSGIASLPRVATASRKRKDGNRI